MQKKFTTGRTVIFYDDRIIKRKEIIDIVKFIKKHKFTKYIDCGNEIWVYETKNGKYRFLTENDFLEKNTLKKIRIHEKIWYLMKKNREI